MTKTCQNCAHFGALVNQCRAHAPVALIGGVDRRGMPVIVGAWPATSKDQWCGEHRAQLAMVA